jgi:HPt (histidine-containing phosphotransfer) domain-containing protein
MDGYLTKPVRRGVLQKEIERVKEPGGSGEQRVEPTEPQPRAQLKEGTWNLKELLERLEGDQAFLGELLMMFRADSRANLNRARNALAGENLAELAKAAHTLKGMLRNLSMNSAGEVAAQLETAARQKQTDEAKRLLALLTEGITELLPEVEAHLAEVKA